MAETRVQILSDLHLESPDGYDIFHVEPNAPYLALLGDIGYVKDDGFFCFLRCQLEVFRVVFLVLGNHEPYCSSWPGAKARVEAFRMGLPQPDRFVLLDRTRYDLSPTVTVLGCTLFSHVAPENQDRVSMGLNDFYLIDEWTVQSHREAHRSDVDWLNAEVERISRLESHREVLVFTHCCPLTNEDVTDPQHQGSAISSGFMTDLSTELCWKAPVVKVWAFGHTHYNCDFQDENGKRVLSNQRGYYSSQAADFDVSKVIEI
ncbi:Ser/Thr protein phosphatase superfamily [Cordyceps javanica]|uniref:Ser/Thr protein phosphatase superfamily n=1 Tax=Cordyceps javanica TaxID=43265 RepID=A0A545V780_9HYPO|nr:Ser/Thr protein phosphatase superfamily [Cordyceps javanica]TQW09257.1 Ser/Thr protein phosphatase superfamily [Cordyceps javanica]